MSLNLARGYTRGNLTKEQRRQAVASLYGRPADVMDVSQLTADEIERMRAIVAAADRAGKVNEFDLNDPPKKPYRHQEFPRLMYHHAKRIHKRAHSQEEVEAALEAGWSKEPFPAEAEQPEIDEASAEEARVIDSKLKKRNANSK